MTARAPTPPGPAVRWLRAAVPDDRAGAAVLGDLHEEFLERHRVAPRSATLWYWRTAIAIGLRYRLHLPAPGVLEASGGRGLWRDFRVALRSLSRSPLFSVTATLTLGVGIGGTTAMFGVVHAVLLKPLPYQDPDALIAVWQTAPGIDAPQFPLSPATYFSWRDDRRAVEAVGIWRYRRYPVVVRGADPEAVDAWQVTEEVLPILRVQPALGRGFLAEDMAPDAPATVLLADGYWRRRFGGDSGIVGRRLTINGHEAVVLGVLPRGFRVPTGPEPALLVPARFSSEDIYVGYYAFSGLARVADGSTVAAAEREAQTVIPRAIDRYGGTTTARAAEMGLSTIVTPLERDVVGDSAAIIWILFGTVGLVLVIACANVATLVLARAEGRHREMAVRRALGATGRRLASHFLAEGLALGAVGGGLGLVAAAVGLTLLRLRAPEGLPRVDAIGLDPAVAAFGIAITLVAVTAFSLLPAGTGSSDLIASLKENGGAAGVSRRRLSGRNALVALEVALAVVLLVGAGLMIRTVRHLHGIDPGFREPDRVLTARLYVPDYAVEAPERVSQIQRDILSRMSAISGVERVGAATSVATENWVWVNGVHVRERLEPEDAAVPMRRLAWIEGDFFQTMGTRLIAGRKLTPDELRSGTPVALVSAGFAAEFWGDPEEALGSHVALRRSGPWQEIVGVVEDVRAAGLHEEAPSMVYFPAFSRTLFGELWVQRDLRFAVKATLADPNLLAPMLRGVAQEVAPGLPITDVRTVADIVADSMAQTTFIMTMFMIAGALALFLGGIGIYGVIAYLVTLRARELGLRMALGATAPRIGWLMVRHGGALALVGVVLGLGTAAALTHIMRAVLVGVEPLDPVTFATVGSGLVVIAVAASMLPALRAARMDPAETLR